GGQRGRAGEALALARRQVLGADPGRHHARGGAAEGAPQARRRRQGMKTRWFLLCALGGALLAAAPAHAIVKMDDGRRLVLGVQPLQDSADRNAYYYVPTYPRLADNADGTLAFLCTKFVDPKGKTGGGLFHALIEFSLPQKAVDDLQKELKKDVPNG